MPAHDHRVPAAYYLPALVAGTRACNKTACACDKLFANIHKVNAVAMSCRHACLHTSSVCLQHIICPNLLQARLPAMRRVRLRHAACRNKLSKRSGHGWQPRGPAHEQRVPAAYHLPTLVKGTRACNESACACATLLAEINKVNAAAMNSRHTCLHTSSVCLQHIICHHLLQARVPAMRARVPAPH